jgi:hypothetical protein
MREFQEILAVVYIKAWHISSAVLYNPTLPKPAKITIDSPLAISI